MAFREFAPFESSNISSVRYEEDQLVLQVTFHNGGTYEYFDIPHRLAEEFERAESKGSFLASEIKGKYRYSKA